MRPVLRKWTMIAFKIIIMCPRFQAYHGPYGLEVILQHDYLRDPMLDNIL